MSGEIIAIVAVGVALAGVIFAWKTSQKNGELSVEMEKRTREHNHHHLCPCEPVLQVFSLAVKNGFLICHIVTGL